MSCLLEERAKGDPDLISHFLFPVGERLQTPPNSIAIPFHCMGSSRINKSGSAHSPDSCSGMDATLSDQLVKRSGPLDATQFWAIVAAFTPLPVVLLESNRGLDMIRFDSQGRIKR
jgi:hypothetical protein